MIGGGTFNTGTTSTGATTNLDVSHSVGSGDFTSYMVIDFSATGGNSVAFSYSWSESSTPTSKDMIDAIVAATPLSFDYSDDQFDRVENFYYEDMAGGITDFTDPNTRYWGLSLGTFIGENLNAVDPGVSWETALVGVSSNFLSHNSLDGWYNVAASAPVSPPSYLPAPTGMLAMIMLNNRSLTW